MTNIETKNMTTDDDHFFVSSTNLSNSAIGTEVCCKKIITCFAVVQQKIHKWNIQLQYSSHKVKAFCKENSLEELKSFHKSTDLNEGVVKKTGCSNLNLEFQNILYK